MPAVVYRPQRGHLMIRIPYSYGTRDWLRDVCGSGSHVSWSKPTWRVSARHLPAVIAALRDRFGEVELVRDQVVGRGKCDTRCTAALLDDCNCECGGANHGVGWLAGYMPVGETTLVEMVGDITRTTVTIRTHQRPYAAVPGEKN
jgi:hypothetical protein